MTTATHWCHSPVHGVGCKFLQTLYEVSDLGSLQKIISIEVDRNCTKGWLKLSQTQYIDSLLAKYNMMDCKPIATPMDPSANLEDKPEFPEDEPL